MNKTPHLILTHLSLVLLWLSAAASTSHAVLVRIDFSGEIDQVFAGDYTLGERQAGMLIYESNTLLTTIVADPPYAGGFYGATRTFTLGQESVDVISYNFIGQTEYPNNFQFDLNVSGRDTTGLVESLQFRIAGPDTFTNCFDLTSAPQVANRVSATFTYFRYPSGGGPTEAHFSGMVDSISVTIVPEPSSALLLVLGGLLFTQRRSKR